MLKLLVGLGNPGAEYTHTRHNVGFSLLEELINVWGISLKFQSKFKAKVAIADGWIYAEPQTFMNASGEAVQALVHFHRIAFEQLLIIHDDLDLVPGRLQLKFGGGTNGHNGLKSVVNAISSDNFWRLRVGIGRPAVKSGVVDYVLGRPRPSDTAALNGAFARMIELRDQLKTGDFALLQQKINSRS